MSLLRAKGDEWTPSGITSTFQILLPSSSDPDSDSNSVTCGLGWRFSCSFTQDSNSQSTILVGAGGNMHQVPLAAWRISLFFDPFLIRAADYGRLSFSIKAPHLFVPKDASHSSSITLPDHGYHNTQIGTYIYTRERGIINGFYGKRRNIVPTVEITVGLSDAAGLSIPRSIDRKLEGALVDMMDGKEVVDLKFYAFSRKSAGYATCPQPVFSKASLLEGYSEALDLRESRVEIHAMFLCMLTCPCPCISYFGRRLHGGPSC
jgi:hypothetical protein